MAQRVVLTGFGAISSIGTGVDEFLAGLRAGRSGARPITRFDTAGFEHTNGCEVVGFEPGRWIHNVDPERLGRASQFSTAAARMAVADAGLAGAGAADPGLAGAGAVDAGLAGADWRDRPGLVAVGTTDGESHDLDQLVAGSLAGGPDRMEPRLAARIRASQLSVAVAQELALTDVEAVTIPTACAAGNYAIGYGYDAVRSGQVEWALCGGADAMCRKTFAAFYRLGTIAPDCCRPFDADRKGILTGEGAGMLVMETLESARARGARIYAEVLGYGLTCDAYHPVAPAQESVARCIALALADAGVKPEEVDLISAHGTGTKANDITESSAIRDVFGDHPPRTVSIKSMLGHTMGAASTLAAIACALAIVHRFVPPTINHRRTDPDCPVDCVPNTAVPAELRVVQNNGLAFGGNNAVVILGRYDEEAA